MRSSGGARPTGPPRCFLPRERRTLELLIEVDVVLEDVMTLCASSFATKARATRSGFFRCHRWYHCRTSGKYCTARTAA